MKESSEGCQAVQRLRMCTNHVYSCLVLHMMDIGQCNQDTFAEDS